MSYRPTFSHDATGLFEVAPMARYTTILVLSAKSALEHGFPNWRSLS